MRAVESSPPHPLRVLVVDDHDDTAVLLTQLLTACGHEVVRAGSYAQAMEAAQRLSIDVLLTDIALPDGDGCDLLAEVRATWPGVRGIAFTGTLEAPACARYEAAGFCEILRKPASIDEVYAALANACTDRASVLPAQTTVSNRITPA